MPSQFLAQYAVQKANAFKKERRQKTYQCFRRCFASKENESTRSTWQAISIPLVLVHLDPSIAFDFDGFVEFLMGRNKTSLIFFFFPIRSRETKLSRDATFLFLLALFTERKRSTNKSPNIKSPNKDTVIEIKFLEGVL